MSKKLPAILFIASPLFLALGWVFLTVTQEDSKSIYWIPAHLSLLFGAVLMIPNSFFFKNLLKGKSNEVLNKLFLFIMLAGSFFLAVQFGIDLVVWFYSDSVIQMQNEFSQLQH